ncbi:MAG: ribonuclease P protein component [Burkholderiaceae bacterium]|nr:ribonuclease P protein component [Burkholderiaceae bacterium]MDO9090944.1 ribonuclease P protein component [Burkholderiaceae bacterium]MDP1968104.1 ribonuclease P protein component [Burkholderiaceae bacterium]
MRRLKTREQFQSAMAGATVSRTPHFALHQLPLAVDASPASPAFVVADVWMGALVPKRWAKRAVTRNAIKRQIYAVSADFEPSLPQAAHVVRLRSTFDRTKFVSAKSEALRLAVRAELQQLFARIAKPTTGGDGRQGHTA